MTKQTQPVTNRISRILALASACFALGGFAYAQKAHQTVTASELSAWRALGTPQRAQAIVDAQRSGSHTYTYSSDTLPMPGSQGSK